MLYCVHICLCDNNKWVLFLQDYIFFSEFLAPGAKAEINIDSQTMELTKQNMKNPTRSNI